MNNSMTKQETGRKMGLDVGMARIGIAVSDPLAIISTGLKAIKRDENSVNEIISLCKQYDIKEVVVGLPRNMDDSVGAQAQDCLNFADKISECLGIKVIMEDERLTSEAAKENLTMRKVDFRKNKELIDIESACIILQQYLDR